MVVLSESLVLLRRCLRSPLASIIYKWLVNKEEMVLIWI